MTKPQSEFRYPCDNCGASLRFQPGQLQMACDYCGHTQKIGKGVTRAPALQKADHQDPGSFSRGDRALQWDAGHKAPALTEIPLGKGLRLDQDSDLAQELRTLSCPNCGARIDILDDVHARACPFCDTAVVTDTGASRQIKPQAVLPFVLTEEQARKAMEDWLGRLWFAPSGLLAYARRGRKMRGVYSPYWTFDASTQSSYSGQRGDAYYETVYVTREVNGRRQRVATKIRKIRWRPARGRVARNFNDVLVLAATSLPRHFTDALTPWDLSHLRPYRPDYLAGFEAEGYTVALADGHQIARQEMAAVIMNDARRDIGGDEQRVDRIETSHRDETFKHILLPIWSAAYKYNGKSYRFLVNAQTGRVQGERPWSVWKITAAVAAALIALAVFLYFAEAGSYVQGSGAISPF